MSFTENVVLSLVRNNLNRKLNLDAIGEISAEGLVEYRDIPYQNRSGKELLMDIYSPIVLEDTELPVIINIHGGGLIDGNKNLSEGFCRQIAKRGYLVCSLEYRLIPSVRVYEQFDDVCVGMDCIGRKLVDFDVDFTRIYLVAESAGRILQHMLLQ